jgi:hypothetical protein
MKFKEFLKLIKQFDCKALEDKEVEHCFSDRMLYGYTEPVVNFQFDVKRNKFRIVTGDIEETHFDNNCLIRPIVLDNKKEKTAQ